MTYWKIVNGKSLNCKFALLRRPSVDLSSNNPYEFCWLIKFTTPLTKQIIKDIHHDDAIVEGMGRDVVGCQYYLGECVIGKGE